jgi:hypothetical protein
VTDQLWYKPIEVERLTGRSRKSVYEALWSGELRGHQKRKGGSWSIPASAVQVWMDGDDRKVA